VKEARASFDNLKKDFQWLIEVNSKREQNDNELWQYIEKTFMKK
jgi:hypothetical protein